MSGRSGTASIPGSKIVRCRKSSAVDQRSSGRLSRGRLVGADGDEGRRSNQSWLATVPAVAAMPPRSPAVRSHRARRGLLPYLSCDASNSAQMAGLEAMPRSLAAVDQYPPVPAAQPWRSAAQLRRLIQFSECSTAVPEKCRRRRSKPKESSALGHQSGVSAPPPTAARAGYVESRATELVAIAVEVARRSVAAGGGDDDPDESPMAPKVFSVVNARRCGYHSTPGRVAPQKSRERDSSLIARSFASVGTTTRFAT